MMDSVENILRTVSESTYNKFLEWAPQMMEDKKLRSLFFGLLNGSYPLKDFDMIEEGRVLATCEWIAYQVDEHDAYVSKNHRRFTAIRYLEQLKAALPMEWMLEWYEPSYQKKLARTVLLTLPNYVYELLNEDLRCNEKPRRYLRSGKRRTKNQQTPLYLTLKDIEAEQQLQAKNDIQKEILAYLHRRSHREFTDPQLQEALAIAQSLKPLAFHTTKIKLANILEYPKPIYHAVEGCYRLYSGSLQYLPSKVRYALYPDMLDIDLKSCHVSILASILELEKTTQLLNSGESFWGYLISRVNTGIHDEVGLELKPVLKKAIYSICFGASQKRVKDDFKAGLESNLSQKEVSQYWKAFRGIDVVTELLNGTASWRKRMQKEGYHIDPFNVRHAVTDSHSARRACFNYCSALELKLIYSVYRIAIAEETKDKPKFRILLHSHDGVTIKCFRPRHYDVNETFSKLKAAVDAEAMKLKIPTTLELKG